MPPPKADSDLYWHIFSMYICLHKYNLYIISLPKDTEWVMYLILHGYHRVKGWMFKDRHRCLPKFSKPGLCFHYLPPILRNVSQVATPSCKLRGNPGDGIMMLFALLWKHLYGTEVQLSMKWCTNLQSSQCNLEFIFFSMCMQLWR